MANSRGSSGINPAQSKGIRGTQLSRRQTYKLARAQNRANIKAGKQQYKAGKQQYKVQQMQQRANIITAKTKSGVIRQAGSAVAEATTPIATNITATKVSEQAYASKNKAADKALASWAAGITGNPGQDGQEGSKQGESTTVSTSAGTFRSIVD